MSVTNLKPIYRAVAETGKALAIYTTLPIAGILTIHAGINALDHPSQAATAKTYTATGPSCKPPLQGQIVLPAGCVLKPSQP
jgi:hypothetical protein